MFIGTQFEEFQNLAKTLPREVFCNSHTGFYLLGKVSSNTPAGEMDFVTGVIHVDELKEGKPLKEESSRRAAKPGNFLAKLEKKGGKTWPEWISIGRAGNNDIVIKHPSVSKLHARLDIKTPQEDSPAKDAGFWIMDLNSSQGTTVNGKPLENAARYPVQQGDSIRLGDVDAVILDADKLYNALLSDSF